MDRRIFNGPGANNYLECFSMLTTSLDAHIFRVKSRGLGAPCKVQRSNLLLMLAIIKLVLGVMNDIFHIHSVILRQY